MATIKATTVLAHPETHEPTVLLAGTEAPDWAADKIKNPDVLDKPKQEPEAAKAPAKRGPAPKAKADESDG